MIKITKRLIKKAFNLIGLDIVRISKNQKEAFLSYHYQRHNQRRLEHLASLGFDVAGSTVLEVGAGIGDHTSFFIERDCQIVSSDARQENIKILHSRYPNVKVLHLDLDIPPKTFNEVFDIVYCYGLLYHVKGKGCRPTRRWVYNQLKRHFEFVYLPITQPNHEEFPIDWTLSPSKQTLTRAVFVASRQKLINKLLSEDIPMKQIRH